MPFQFTCPYCFKKTFVSEELAGEEGPCVGCGKLIQIPPPPRPLNPLAHPVGGERVRTREKPHEPVMPRWLLKAVCISASFPLVFGLLFWLFWPSITSIKRQRDIAACQNNLQRIAKALNDYAAAHGSYPPAIVRDASGKALHSWRVLILPFLGESSLYARYDLGKSWDSTENATMVAQCPSVFISPGTANSNGSTESNYMLLTGPNTIFLGNKSLAPKDIGDGLENTLLVVEVQNSKISWTEPIDIDYTKLNPKIGSLGPNAIGGSHATGATAVLADGTPIWIPSDTSPTLLNSIITPNGLEPVDATWLQDQ